MAACIDYNLLLTTWGTLGGHQFGHHHCHCYPRSPGICDPHVLCYLHTMSLAHFPGMIPDAFFGKCWPTCAEWVSCLICDSCLSGTTTGDIRSHALLFQTYTQPPDFGIQCSAFICPFIWHLTSWLLSQQVTAFLVIGSALVSSWLYFLLLIFKELHVVKPFQFED